MSEVATYSQATSLVPHNVEEALRLAEFMARARTVPKHLHDSPGDCLMVIEQAMRWGMSPFAVAQATSVISGKLMYEGKLVAAAVETSGAIVGHIDYDFAGEGDGRSITVSATRRGETNPRTVTVAFKDARTNNEMWKRQPDQQLTYHSVRVWARRWTPAVILGVYSREEMGPIIEGEAIESTATDAREQMNRDIPLKAAAAPMPRGARVAERAPAYEAPPEPPRTRTRRDFLDGLAIALRDAQDAEEVDRIVCAEEVMRAKELFKNGHKEELDKLINAALNKWWTEPPAVEELPDVEIAGADKVAAGD